MKRIFAFLCAIALLLTSIPAVAVSAMSAKLAAANPDVVEVAPQAPELFPDRYTHRPVKNPQTALEHNLPDGFAEYLAEYFSKCEGHFSIEQFNFPYSRWQELAYVIWDEMPEMFNVYSLGCSYSASNDRVLDVVVRYYPHADTVEEYNACWEKMQSAAEYLIQGVKDNSDLTDVEKALILHDRLAVWTQYDVAGMNAGTKNKIHTAYGPLGDGAAVCQGYAMAYMYLLDLVGIESDYCSSDTLNHGWNIVYIDGQAYHVDVTWDDPIDGYSAQYSDTYGRVYHNNFLRSTTGIRDTGHDANDYISTSNDTRYDDNNETTWWKRSSTAVQLIDNRLYYLDENNMKVICADNGQTVYTLADYYWYSKLSGAEGKLLLSTEKDVLSVDPDTGADSVVYTTQNGYITGMKYEKGKLYIQLEDDNDNTWRESVDLAASQKTEFTYAVENGEATITGYNGVGDNITIPDTVDGYPVTAIGEHAFESCKGIVSVTIPNSVEYIGFCAFTDCSNLVSLTVGNGVKSIGEWAFAGCTGLTGVYIKDLAAWCEIAFDDSTSNPLYLAKNLYLNDVLVTDLVIPQGVTSVKWLAFNGCASVISVTIPDSVTTIDDAAFFFCPNLTTVTLASSVTYIGEDTFGYCPNVTDVYYDGTKEQWESVTVRTGNDSLLNATVHYAKEPVKPEYTYIVENGGATITGYNGEGGDITIPDTVDGYAVTKIDEWAFSSCTSLLSVTIPEGVIIIGEGAFYGCSNITSVSIPDSVSKIGAEAFCGCIRLTSVTIPEGIDVIYQYAFYYCESLASVTIPESVTDIGENAFNYCTNLTDVYYAGTELQWVFVYVCEGNEQLQNATMHFAQESEEPEEPEVTEYTYTVENGEATITGYNGDGGDITIPDTLGGYPVTAIGDWAFSSCASLIKVTIPDSVTTIGNTAFYLCTGLTSLTIPGSVISLGEKAFGECYNLADLYITDPSAWCKINSGNEDDSSMQYGTRLHILDANGQEVTNVVLDDTVREIPYMAFHNCESLTSVTIPDSVTTVGRQAFYECTNLTTVTIGDSVTTIGEGAFRECTSLTSVTIPDSVTAISDTAFQSCSSLISATIGDGVTTIGDYAFSFCYGLTSVTIGDSITVIGNAAFVACNSLKTVYYAADRDKWDQISIGEANERLTNARIYFAGEKPVSGDLDENQAVDEDDAIYLLQHLLMPDDFPVYQAVDYDQNDVIDEDDVIYLLQHLLMPDDFPL